MLVNLILIVLCGHFAILLLLAIYCRIMRSRDKNDYRKKNENRFSRKWNDLLNHFFYGFMRYSIIKCGRVPSHHLRNYLYHFVFCMNITNKTIIYGGCEFRSPWKIKADRCIIMSNSILDARAGINIGQDVVFGNGVHIWTEEHDINDPHFGVGPNNRGSVVIKDHAWICSDSTILPNITIGEGAVVASRACVVKNCDDYTVYGGVPAQKISNRSDNLMYELSSKPHWSFY